MKIITKELAKNILLANAKLINFGTSIDAPSFDLILKAEKYLGRQFSNSYKWFLSEFGGGEIGGEEIYSLYDLPYDSASGDIVHHHLINRKLGQLNDSQLSISETDFGEIFYFDYSFFTEHETPIYERIPSGKLIKYASNFYEYLYKRVGAHGGK